MDEGLILVSLTALWLGVLTSISPCPLATNVAAISFISNRLTSPGRVLMGGLLYTAGRMLAYVVLGIVLTAGLMSIPGLSMGLQKYMNKLLGPILILVGLVLLGMVTLPSMGLTAGDRFQKKAASLGLWGAGLMGIVFAVSFCPTSAALFFGSLISLSLKPESPVALGSLFGFGTALPVVAFALLVALGAGWVGRTFDMITRFELWARRVTGVIFILAGIYYVLAYIFGISLW